MSDLDNLIDEWHDSDAQEPLSKYLGVRDSDYKLWVIHRDPEPSFYSVGLVDSPQGHEIMTEARVKLGLPIRAARQNGGES